MQKVSKQSLAMIALSILLAISIALTFTFAALQDSKTATGTITFSDGFSLTEVDGTSSFTITPKYGTNSISYELPQNLGWTITNNTNGNLVMEVKLVFSADNTGALKGMADPVTATDGKMGTFKLELTSERKTKSILLKDLLTIAESDTTNAGNVEGDLSYTVTITVNVVDQSSATVLA